VLNQKEKKRVNRIVSSIFFVQFEKKSIQKVFLFVFFRLIEISQSEPKLLSVKKKKRKSLKVNIYQNSLVFWK